MPVDFLIPFKRLLKEIITVSSGIRDSALDLANAQNFDASEKLSQQLETIRISADAILRAFAKATLTSHSLDQRLTDWLASKEPHSCLEKLKELNDALRSIGPDEHLTPSLTPAEDELTKAIIFFDIHKTLFLFLLTPHDWNRERLGHLHSEASQVGPPPLTVAKGNENGRLSDLDQPVVTGRKKELHQKLNEISRWLNPMECVQKHRGSLGLRQEGTCKWFLDTNAYKIWRTPGSHFLWLHGKGGCGKSVLIAYTIERLKIGLEKEEVVASFYCDFRDKRSTSSIVLMRSLLSQLLCHIRDHAVDPGEFPDKILKQKSERTLSLDDLRKLCNLVSRAASFFRYEPMIIIDALDECADIETLLPALVALSQSDVRLLVTSRPDQTIADHFTGLQSLSFEAMTNEIGSDIALHVKLELDLHSRLRSAISVMRDEICAKLTKKAEGRFRWVQCQLDALKRCTTREELMKALDALPNELEATYERILGAIDERKSEGDLARRVLVLLMVAIEPLQHVQVIDGLSMDFHKRTHDSQTQEWLETKLLDSLSSLVSYDEGTDALALSHYSVKEYLTGRSALPMYQIITDEAHAEVAEMCMGYISVFLKQESSHFNLERFPMLFYVLSSGLSHLAYVNSQSYVALGALESLGSDVRGHPSHWDRLCELREELLEWPYVPWPSSKHDFLLYTLIAYSPPGLLRTFLTGNYSLQPRIRTNPLVYAAELRKTEHAMVLLACGADVDAQAFVIDDSYRASPIEVAIDLGDEVLVEELLQRECLMTPKLLATAACMPWCSTCVLTKLMQTDEFVEWALGIGEEELYRSVFSGARPTSRDSTKADEEFVVLARRMRQFGLDLSTESPFGRELIKRALRAAHMSLLQFLLPPDEPPPAEFLIAASTGDTSETVPVVRFLLERGVDVHAISDEYEDTALHLAAMCLWEPRSLELTRLLIDAGCEPHALNSDGEICLVVAVRHGHCSVVELLLSCNIPLPSDVLHIALGRPGNSRMIEFLLNSGANVRTLAQFTRDTILHHAIIGPEREYLGGYDDEHLESECLCLVKRFLKAGCDATARNSRGDTPLEMAMARRLTSVVELLVSLDVPLPSNVLLTAVRHGSTLETVEYLIHGGADVHSITPNGDTVLHLALRTDHYSEETCYRVVVRLIDAGCDATARNSGGEIALEIALERKFTSVVELLLSPDVPLPPNVLLTAVWHGSTLEMVESLMHRGADVNSIAPNGDTVLHLALHTDHHSEETCYRVVGRLIDAGCDATARNSEGEIALEIALERKFTSVVELLLSPDVPFPPNVLLTAVRHGLTLETVESLIHRGANVHSIAPNGDTVLHLTLRTRRYSEETCYRVVERLLDAGCDATARNSEGEIALEIALECNFISVVNHLLSLDVPLPPNVLLIAVRHGSTLEMVESLIHRGADVHSVAPNGDTVLHLTLRTRHYSEETCCKVVVRLIDAGCDATARNSKDEIALEIALERNFISVVNHLLSLGVPLPPDVLLTAVQRGSALEIVEYLIHRGADIHSVTFDGDTILHLALHTRHYSEETCYKMAGKLVDAGCDTAARNSKEEMALEIALERNFTSVVKLLLSPNVPLPPNVLLTAVRRGSILEMVEYLIHRGADMHFVTSDGDTVLHLALRSHHYSEETCYKVVEKSIDAGCDATARNSAGKTALDMAIEFNSTSVVELLLSSNILLPPDVLLTAVQRSWTTPDMIKYLIHKGANVHFTASSGDTVLHLALWPRNTSFELVRILINAGCDTIARNSTGKTALDIAMEYNCTSVANLLLSNIPTSPYVLLVALEQGWTPERVERLVHMGADVHITTSDRDTVLHLTLITKHYPESACYQLVKTFVSAGCNTAAHGSTGKTALELAIQRNFTSVVELLLPFDVPLPPDLLLIAIQQRSTLEMLEYLIHRGANIHSTMSNGNTALHLVLATYYTEEECCKIVQYLAGAGCNPSTRNSKGNAVLLDALERDYSSVAELLLSFDIPPDILQIALGRRSKPQVIQVLVGKGATDHLRVSSGSDWEALLRLARASYSGQDSQEVIAILEAARKACRAHSNFEDVDEPSTHVAKRPRLDEPVVG